MSLDGTQGTTYSAPTTTTTSTLGAGTSTSSTDASNPLGENAFLQLMMTQLKDQDPLNPSDPSQYLGELAQMTSVEQETETAQSVQATQAEQSASSAIALIGHSIDYTDSTGATQTGVVQSVQFTSSGPSLTVDGVSGISMAGITEVQ